MKRITALLSALAIMITAVSCSRNDLSVTESEPVSAVMELSAPAVLENHMTEKERSKITVGELTVFDHMQQENKDEVTVPSDAVYFEIWTAADQVDFWEHYRENHPEDTDIDDECIESTIEYYKDFPDVIHEAFIDGELFMLECVPDLDYDGGELTIEEELPAVMYYENGKDVYKDRAGNDITEDEYIKSLDEYYGSDHTVTFADFEEFKPYLRERVGNSVKMHGIPSGVADTIYESNVKMWEAVIDKTYKVVPAGTAEEWSASRNNQGNTDTWEIDRGKVEEIAPYVREYNIYDEQLDTNFVVHVTLPPDFKEDGVYPAYVLTDGVWRFNNCADMRKEMEEGKAAGVILVSIGYDYSIDGTNDDYRIKYFCDKCEDFLTFITDDLMPYLGEEYNIDYGNSTFFGHSLGGTFSHYALFNSDKYKNQPFKNYIIGSPAFWSPGFLPYTDGDEYKNEYGYFDRNEKLDKNVFICGGADEDPVYEEYYGENDSTLEGIKHLEERLKNHGVTTVESKIYPDSEHYQFIPEMLAEMLEKYYPAQ